MATFSATASTSSAPPWSASTWTSYGAIDAGQTIPFSSCRCSTAAAITRAGPDAVAAADQRLLRPVLVEEGRPEWRRVAVVELEDVPDLDRGLEAKCAAALGHAVAFVRLADVGEAGLVVAPGLRHRAGASRRGSRPRRTARRGAPRRRRPRRRRPPGRASRRPRRTPLGSRRRSRDGSRFRAPRASSTPRAGRRRERARARACRRLDHRHRLRGRRAVDAEHLGECLDGRHAWGLDLLRRRRGRSGSSRYARNCPARSRDRPRSRRSRT